MPEERRDTLTLFRAWLVPSAVMIGAFALIYGGTAGYDFFFYGVKPRETGGLRSLLEVIFVPDPDGGGKDVLGTIGQAVPGVLGIAITVVAIIVELASNRYTSQVSDLFIQDKTNLIVIGMLVIASIQPLWIAASFGGGFTPHLGVLVSLMLASASFLLLIPYFSYVFTFLQPGNIIRLIRENVRQAISSEALRKAPAAEDEARRLLEVKQSVSTSVEQIADIALNSILQRDRALAMDAVDAARGVVFDYFEQKARMPAAWFKILPEERSGNPDYVTLADEGLEDIENDRVWVEHKVMKQLHLVFVQALNNLRDLNNLIAMFLKDVALEALKRDDRAAHRLTLKFFNTSLRSAFAAKDVRTAYNILYQYRQLADRLVRDKRLFLIELVFGYFKYYGLLFDSGNMGFILETVAYDMYRLLRVALDEGLSNVEALLDVFLEVDRPPDAGGSDVHLRGVRKAQGMFAAYALSRGRRDLAERIGQDMKAEPTERLRSIREEIHAAERAFWEITDRGVNFDFLDADLRPHLDRFFDEILNAGPRPAPERPRSSDETAQWAR